ncbi:RelA-associated inhibitor [Nibea albiflora]|uniref:RelA-associated inhibitor n=1 Tax=Nibea albiflora TaxID=240163 RepID=A0ACB7EHX3_NIBAL|nr:RelA-associated inhibitor [Nibea albiflora]
MSYQASFGSSMLFESINDDLNASLATADELSREFSSMLNEASSSNNNNTTNSGSEASPTVFTEKPQSYGLSNTSITTRESSTSSNNNSQCFSPISTTINASSSPVSSPKSSPKTHKKALSPLPRVGSDSYMYGQHSSMQPPRSPRHMSPSRYDRSPRGSVSYIDRSPSPSPTAISFDQSRSGSIHSSSNLLSPFDSSLSGRRSPRRDRSPSPLAFNHPLSNTLPQNFGGFRQADESVQRQRSPGKWNETDLDVSYERKPHHNYDKTEWLRPSVPNSSWRESNLDGPPPAPSPKKDHRSGSHQFSSGSLPRNAQFVRLSLLYKCGLVSIIAVLNPADIDAELERLDFVPHMSVIPENPRGPEGNKEVEQGQPQAPRPLSPTRLQPVVAPEAQSQEIPDLEVLLRLRAEIPRALKRRGSVDHSRPQKKASQYQPNQYKHLINKLFRRSERRRKGEQGSETSSSSEGEESAMPPARLPQASSMIPPDFRMNDPSQPNDEGITALHNAICGGHYNVVDFLVRIGANVSAPDSHGWTPLHCAASCNDRPLCVEEAMGVDNSGVLYALWSYPAQAPDELSFKEGDMVTILQKPEGSDWWWASLCGREGFVPNNYFGVTEGPCSLLFCSAVFQSEVDISDSLAEPIIIGELDLKERWTSYIKYTRPKGGLPWQTANPRP